MRRLLAVAALVLLAVPAAAQSVRVPSPNTARLVWDHDGANTDGYALTLDGVRAVVTPACAVTDGVRSCEVPFPALTPGTHTLVVSAFNAAGEGLAPILTVEVFVAPGNPTNVRIVVVKAG